MADMDIDIDYVQKRIGVVGSTQHMTVQETPKSVLILNEGKLAGELVWSGKTFHIWYHGEKFGYTKSIDKAIDKFREIVSKQKYFKMCRMLQG